MSKILVVGGAGYIGSILVRRLLGAGHRVRVLDRLLFGDASIRDLYARSHFELFEGDFRDQRFVKRALAAVDAVVHLGAIVGDPACRIDESATIETNYEATHLIARLARAAGVSRMVFASTCSVYGGNERLVDELSPANPLSLYARTKLAAETLLLGSGSSLFHPTVLRIGTAFGWSYRPRFDLVINLLTCRAHFEKRIAIYNQNQWRPFVHVEDVARAVMLALEAPLERVSGQVFNVGSTEMNCRLGHIGEVIGRLMPGVQVVHELNTDARSYRVSFDKVLQAFGFQCRMSVRSGVREIYRALLDGSVNNPSAAEYHNHKAAPVPGRLLGQQPAGVPFEPTLSATKNAAAGA